MTVLRVSELNEQIKSLLESHFQQIYVEGEVSRPTYHGSGHLYFTLKDEKSSIRCVMFRGDLRNVPFRVEEGQHLIITGRIGLYAPRGEYQIYAKELHPAGTGSLQLAFEQLKKRLQSKGYFDKQRPLPTFVRSIALVTSKTGAALQDMLRIVQNRWPMVKVYVVDTLVQGKEAASSIAQALEFADTLEVDVVVVGRGGGSLEDLWAFNEEIVADAIFKMQKPVVSAVGHEIDYVISDFVADHRAPTPSAAMEMILPDQKVWLLRIDDLFERLVSRMEAILKQKREGLEHIMTLLYQQSPQKRLGFYGQQIEGSMRELTQAFEMVRIRKERQIPQMKQALDSLFEHHITAKQNAIKLLTDRFEMALKAKKLPDKSAQIIKEGRVVGLDEVEVGDRIELQDMKYRVEVSVDAKTKI